MNKSKIDISTFCNFYKDIKNNNVLITYEGEISEHITESMLSVVDNAFISKKIEVKTKKKVYNVMIESLQNISKHEFKNSNEFKPDFAALFMISSTDNEFHIITGNAVKKESVEIVKERIDEINSLDQEGLKLLLKKARLNSILSDVGGFGLGLIDIARKSGEKIHYNFEKLTNDIFYYTQLVTINK